MSEDEIMNELSKASNLVELVTLSRELKGSGEDERIVNRAMRVVRQQLSTKVSNINKLTKVPFPSVKQDKISYVSFQVVGLNVPVIEIGDEVVSL